MKKERTPIKNRRNLLFTIVLAIALAGAACENSTDSGPPPSPEATFEGLGDLGDDSFYSSAYAVSADGSVVVGHSRNPDGNTEAFRWEDGTMTGLGTLGGDHSFVFGVSPDGSVVVGRSTNTDDHAEAFRWKGGAMTGLGYISDDSYLSQADGTSADGSVVVGYSWPSVNSSEAFRWEGGAMAGLGTLGHTYSAALNVSSDGLVVVGRSWNLNGNSEAFRWKNGAMQALGDLSGGSFLSEAHAVSADGSVVVGWGTSGSGREAFIWTAAEGMQSLQAVLENEYNLDLMGWTLTEARGISDDGTVIVGYGTNPNSDIEAWRAFLGEPVAETAAN